MNPVALPCRRSKAVFCKRHFALLALAALAGPLLLPGAPQARQNSVNGTLALGSDHDSNVFQSDRDREDEWRSLLAPELTVASRGLTDTLSLTYAPEFRYNHRREDDEITQALSFMADKGLSSRWKVTLNGDYASYDNLFFEADTSLSVTQNFLRADSATQAEIVRILFPELVWDPTRHLSAVISQFQNRFDVSPDQALVRELLFQGANGVRQEYWTSGLTLNSEYEFADRSTLVLGYRLISQDNKTGRVADHLGHTPSVLLTYQFNQAWRAAVGYELGIDTYDDTDDSTSDHPHLQVDFQLSPKDLLYWNYDYRQITFDEERGTTDQGPQLGWNHSFSQHMTGTAVFGISYLGLEVGPDEREYTLDLGLTRTFERGSVGVRGTGMTAVASTLGAWERSRQSWEVGSDLTYRLWQELTSTGRVSYGQWDSWGVGVDLAQSPYDQLRVGAGLRYLFKRWYTLSLDYNYSLFDTEGIILDDYTEHLISLRLAAAKELWRW